MICMASNKQNDIYYRQQFGEVYEFALNYVHTLKRRLATSIQDYEVSDNNINERIDSNAQQQIAMSNIMNYTQMYENELIERHV